MNIVIVYFPLISIFWSVPGGHLQAVSKSLMDMLIQIIQMGKLKIY